MHLRPALLALLFAAGTVHAQPAATSAPTEAPAEGAPASILTPLYPLWEGTGRVLAHRRLYLGSSHLELGLLDRVQVGVHPVSFLFRTPNVHAKLRLLERGPLSVAAQAELNVFLPGASEAFVSSNYVSRLDNTGLTVTVVPVGVAATYAVSPWLYLHATGTLAGIFDNGPLQERVVPGLTLVAEALALQHHSLFAHLGEVGFWEHDQAVVGLSYRYHRGWFEARLGYVYRFMKDGSQGSPLLALGAFL
jgi:hypothetical protein